MAMVQALKCLRNIIKSWKGRDSLKMAATNVCLNFLLTGCGLFSTKVTKKGFADQKVEDKDHNQFLKRL